MARKRRNQLADLTPYLGCEADAVLGIDPLAVGWLNRRDPFETGVVPADFGAHLLLFCLEAYTVCPIPAVRPCALGCREVPPLQLGDRRAVFGRAEIRVIGDDAIYAAPTLIYHYVTAHRYRPPDEFITAVRHGPQPGSPEHRALIRTLQQVG